MEQFKHTGQLLFNATFFFSSSHAHMQLTQTEGWGVGLVQSVRTYGLICYSLLDRGKTEGEKVLIFLPIWLRVDPGATLIFITQMWWCWWWWGVTLVLPVSMATRIIQVRGGQAAGERRIWVH